MEDLIITPKEHKLLKKFQKRLQNRYHVKFQMPDVAVSTESDVIFMSIIGDKQNRECVKKFLSDKKRCAEKVEQKDDVLLITLSDSEDEPNSDCDINSRESSVCIVEDIPSRKNAHSRKSAINSSDSLDNSVCVIESTDSPKIFYRVFGKAPNMENDNKENRSIKRAKMKNKKVRSKSILPSSLPLEEEEEICEVSSTTDELEPKKRKLREEINSKKESPAEFIPLFICENPGSKSSPVVKDNLLKEPKEDVVVLDESTITSRTLRPIVIDGSNVAYEHGKVSRTFSAKGIQLAVEYFLNRGHTQVTAFIPKFRRRCNRPNFPTTDSEILDELEKKQLVVYTPSRRVNGKCIASYDDRFIVQLASTNGGIIVSNDNYRDLLEENESFKEAIEKRLLMFCFVGDIFMVPDDPLGRDGPSLSEFLSFPPEAKVD